MPRCACGGATCSCVVVGEAGIEVLGAGSAALPYRVRLVGGSLAQQLIPVDTDTLDLSLVPNTGGGDGYLLSGDVTLRVGQLTDVDPTDVPTSGDVLTWDGSKWVFAPGSGGGGATVVTARGVGGNGSAATPVVARNSGTWGAGDLTDAMYGSSFAGQAIYVDADGNLRSAGLNVGQRSAAQLPSLYPGGLSTAIVNTADGWPAAGHMVTNRRGAAGAGVATQALIDTSGVTFSRYGSDANGWTPWTVSGANFNDQAICNTPLTVPVAPTDIAGMSITVPVRGPSAVFLVDITLDVAIVTATNANFIGGLVAGGAAGTAPQIIWTPTTAVPVNGRQPLTRTYRVTGLPTSNGTVFRAQASCTVAGVYRVNPSHSTITVTQIS